MNTATHPLIKRPLDLDKLVILDGAHDDPEGDVTHETPMCIMEAVAALAGEDWGDHPDCVCPSFGFLRNVNDRVKSTELRTRMLRPLVLVIMGTKSTKAVADARNWILRDWVLRTETPRMLRIAGMTA